MNNKSPAVKQQCAEPGKLFAAAGSGAAVETTQHNVPVAGVLSGDARVHDHDAPVQIAHAKHNALRGKQHGAQKIEATMLAV